VLGIRQKLVTLKTRQATIGFVLILIAGLLVQHQGMASTASVEQQRALFHEAETALEKGDRQQFSALLKDLQDYPVRAYLEYDDFAKSLAIKTPQQVKQFLQHNKEYPFAYHLRTRWLSLLAKRQRWKTYLQFYDGRSAVKFKCLQLTAKIKTGQLANINSEIRKLWLTGYSQPEQCDLPFQHFLKTADDTEQAIWLRIEKAFAARRPALAKYLAKKLPEEARKQVDLWYQAHRKPEKYLPQLASATDTELNRKIIIHCLQRMARRDSLKARAQWVKLRDRFKFNQHQINLIDKRIALSAALQHKPESKQLLKQLPDDIKTDTAHLWLARIHLRDEDWIGLIKTINAMPKHLSAESEWVYWLARAYEEAGKADKARQIFDKLASKSTYYGFLAADRIDRSYHIVQQRATAENSFDEVALLKQNIHLLRARELFFLNRLLDARREWFQGIRKLKQKQIRQAATMASSWKWHDNAIKTVAKTPHRSDYDLRFPMPYRKQVAAQAEINQLDLSVIYGVMRRESLFDPLARSRVGALGLMQLMPATARRVAKSLGMKRPQQKEIMSVTNNIQLGAKYFRSVLNRFENNVSLAAAAYNAGPRNVKRWLPEKDNLPADLWVETVPFKETRNYVQAVLAYATIFDKHLGKNVQISSRMDDIKPEYSPATKK
jgi:soluble lytic murein transglycosylase